MEAEATRQKAGDGREYGLGWCGAGGGDWRDWRDARDWRDFRENGSIGRRKKRQGTDLSVSPVHPVSPVPPVPSVIGQPGPRPEKKGAIPNPCRRTRVPRAADGSVAGR